MERPTSRATELRRSATFPRASTAETPSSVADCVVVGRATEFVSYTKTIAGATKAFTRAACMAALTAASTPFPPRAPTQMAWTSEAALL